jgi:hypothetical protein
MRRSALAAASKKLTQMKKNLCASLGHGMVSNLLYGAEDPFISSWDLKRLDPKTFLGSKVAEDRRRINDFLTKHRRIFEVLV